MSASALQAPSSQDRDTTAKAPTAPRRALPVRFYLLLLAVAVLLPLLVLAGLLTERAVQAERARAAQAVAATAGGVLTVVDREVAGLIETLQTLETSPSLTAGDLQAFHQQIGDLARIVGVDIRLRDPAGRLLASSLTPWNPGRPGPPLPSPHDAALLAERQVVVTGVQPAPAAGRAVFSVMMPVQRNGEVRYLLDLAPPVTRLRDVLASLRVAPLLELEILDGSGLVIARAHGHDAAVGRPSALRAAMAAVDGGPMPHIGRGTDGEGRAVYFHALRSQYGWTIVTSLLVEQIDGPRRRALIDAALFALLLTGAAVLAVRFLSTRLAGAIRGLAVAGSALDRGEPVAIAPSGIREIDEVAGTLGLAGERLRAAAADRSETEERQRLILHELNHRLKNTIAMVQALAALAARGAPDVDTYRDRLTERLGGLARTQALLTGSEVTGAQLDALLRAELGMYEDAARPDGSPSPAGEAPRRISIGGPPVRLPGHHVVAFGMLIHELGTNAAKYGALSTPQGRLSVRWTLAVPVPGETWVDLLWQESGGPPVVAPSHQGFGTRMISRGLARQLGAEVETEWRPEGLHFRLRMPLDAAAPRTVPVGAEEC